MNCAALRWRPYFFSVAAVYPVCVSSGCPNFFSVSTTPGYFLASCEMTNCSWLVFIASSKVCSASNSDFNSAVPSRNLEIQKRHSISINYHGSPGSALSCSSSIMLESTSIIYLYSAVGWSLYFGPVLFSHANPLPPSLSMPWPPFLPLISLLPRILPPSGKEKMWISIDSLLAT